MTASTATPASTPGASGADFDQRNFEGGKNFLVGFHGLVNHPPALDNLNYFGKNRRQ